MTKTRTIATIVLSVELEIMVEEGTNKTMLSRVETFHSSTVSQHCSLFVYSGLAVEPNMDDDGPDRDRVFGMAENATSEDSQQVRRTITMVSGPPFHRD